MELMLVPGYQKLHCLDIHNLINNLLYSNSIIQAALFPLKSLRILGLLINTFCVTILKANALKLQITVCTT